jgi:transcriptional regulator with XRE-family HTH domain
VPDRRRQDVKNKTLVFDAEYIRALRQQAGLTIEQAAFAMGLDKDGLGAIENPDRRTMISRVCLRTLSTFYGAKERNLYYAVKGRNAGDEPNNRPMILKGA